MEEEVLGLEIEEGKKEDDEEKEVEEEKVENQK